MTDDAITARLDRLAERLERIEERLAETDGLREQLDHSEAQRRELATQTSWLIEQLQEAKKDLRWHERQRRDAEGDG